MTNVLCFLARYLASFCMAALLAPACANTNQRLALAENKRVEAAICPDSMNRIAVANDRITQIFGDEGTFESQNDENTGQVFLKPTAENGTKDLSLTLITEQGITQDLTLKPTARSATTLIFKNTGFSPDTSQKTGQATPNPSANPFGSGPFEVQPSLPAEHVSVPQPPLLDVLKRAVRGQLVPEEKGFLGDDNPSRPNPEGVQVSFHRLYASGPWEVHAFQVKNTLETPVETEEKSFYQPGDAAISLQRRILPPGAQTLLYVVRVSDTHFGAHVHAQESSPHD